MTVREALLAEAVRQAEGQIQGAADRAGFVWWFFKGYRRGVEGTGVTVTIDDGKNSFQKGFDAGLAYFQTRDACGAQSLSLADFGHELLTLKGLYSSGFETSEFLPANRNARWWVHFRKGVVDAFADPQDPLRQRLFSRKKKPCVFEGYLAPDRGGWVGRRNMYDRRFVVTEILSVGLEAD